METAAAGVGAGAAAVEAEESAGGRHARQLAEVRVGPHSNIERRSGIEVCGVRGRLPTLIDRRFNSAIEGERLGRLPPAKGLDEVRRATRALQPRG
eukprot:3399518-Pleurochrysis_carterae.AAC.2